MPKRIRITNKELWNLDTTLADIIHQYLVAFKAYDRHLVLYSSDYEDTNVGVDDIRDETEWFLDELIWTFNALAHGIPEVEDLAAEVFGVENAVSVDESGRLVFNVDEEKREELRQLQKETQERIDNGLMLFAKNFQRLWD